MILSSTHSFIFIKGLKVGGTSIEIALSTICGADDIVTPITAIDELTRLSTSGGATNHLKRQAAKCLYLQALLAAILSSDHTASAASTLQSYVLA